MKKLFVRSFQIWFKTIELFLPGIAKKWAVNLFFTPLRYSVPQREKGAFKRATITKVPFHVDPHELYNVGYAKGRVLNRDFNSTHGKEYFTLYEWGEGDPVLLVHGWSGRARQMSLLAESLADNGFKVISFDAFAHGTSPGKQTTVLEFIKIIKRLSENYGPFKAMIGHSLGGIACGKAIVEGVRTDKLITIGSPTTFQYLLDTFGQIINASSKTIEYIKEFVEGYAKAPVEKYSLTNIARTLDIPGLIIHDRDDKEASYENAPLFNQNWQKGTLVTTSGLGHSRSLRDTKIIHQIIDFVSVKEKIAI